MDTNEKETYRFDREMSVLCYGIAILIMMISHFGREERTGSWTGIFLDSHTLSFLRMGLLSCVSIYAFISGFGFGKNGEKQIGYSVFKRFQCDCKYSVVHYLNFMKKFWLVFVIFVPLGILFGEQYSLKEILTNFAGIHSSINREWWYVKFYITLLLIYPFCNGLFSVLFERFSRWKVVAVGGGISIMGCFLPMLQNKIIAGSYFVFLIGYLFARLGLLDHMRKRRLDFLYAVIGLAGIWIACMIRYHVFQIEDKSFDFLFTPIFIVCIMKLYNRTKESRVWKFIHMMGKNSLYIWLTHTFFIYYYFQPYIMQLRYGLVIVGVWLMIELAISYGLEKIQALLDGAIVKLYSRKRAERRD